MTRANQSSAHARNGKANGHRNGHGPNGHADRGAPVPSVAPSPDRTSATLELEDDELNVTIVDPVEDSASTNGHVNGHANGHATHADIGRLSLEDARKRSASRRKPSSVAVENEESAPVAIAEDAESVEPDESLATPVAARKQPGRRSSKQAARESLDDPQVDGSEMDGQMPSQPAQRGQDDGGDDDRAKPASDPFPQAKAPQLPPEPETLDDDNRPTEITELREVADRSRDKAQQPGWVRQPTPNQQSVPSRGELARHLAWHVCPFCGHRNESARHACGKCGRVDTDDTRRATVRRQGPWFLQQPDNPNAPGVRFAVLQEMVRTGEIHSGSVIRGPTTTQLWTFAARVRGLGHLFGLCWKCNRRLLPPEPGENPDDFCIYCGALLEAPGNPDQQLEAVREATPKAGDPNKKAMTPALPAADQPRGTEMQMYRSSARRRPAGGYDDGYADEYARGSGEDEDFTPLDVEEAPAILDGKSGDGLLSQQELATVFDLDRKRLLGGAYRRRGFPWGKLLLGLVVVLMLSALAFAVFNFFGSDGSDLLPGIEVKDNVMPPTDSATPATP